MSTRKPISTTTGNVNKRKKRDTISTEPINKNSKLEEEIPVLLESVEDIPDADSKLMDVEIEKEGHESSLNKPDENPNDQPLISDVINGDESSNDETENKTLEKESSIEMDNKEENISREFYLNNSGYATLNKGKTQYYAKDHEKNEIYYSNEDGELVYAYKTINVDNEEQRVEFPTVKSDGKPVYIYNEGIPKYPENLNTSEIIFPIDPATNEEMYLQNSEGELIYPRNKNGRQFYRKNIENKEIILPKKGYATDKDGSQIYPKLANNDEYYLRVEDQEFGAIKRINDDQYIYYYARKANGDEIYPRAWAPKVA